MRAVDRRVTRGRFLLLAGLAIAIFWFISITPPADAASQVTLTNTTTVNVNKGSSNHFKISNTGCCFASNTFFSIHVISISPADPQNTLRPQFSTSTPTVNSSFTLKFSPTSSAVAGTYSMTIRGNFSSPPNTNNSNSLPLTLVVGDFSFSIPSDPVTARQGSSGSLGLTVNSVSNFAGQVAFSWQWVTAPSTGVSVSFNPNPVTVPIQGSSLATMSVQASLSAPVGTYTGDIVGTTPDGYFQKVRVIVVVQSIPTLVVSITANPNPAVVSKISTITVRVTSDGVAIQDAALTLSTTGSTLGATSGTTDGSGQFLTSFNSTVP